MSFYLMRIRIGQSNNIRPPENETRFNVSHGDLTRYCKRN